MTVTYKPLSGTPQITLTSSPNPFTNASDLPAGTITDHMVEADWDAEHGWSQAVIKPFGPIPMDPTASVLHYATTCFEGMKAYRSADGKKVLLFRPRDNFNRLNDSTKRASLPSVDVDAAIELLNKFVEIDSRFIAPGYYIYLRPMVMGVDSGLGVKTPTKAKFMILANIFPRMNTQPLKLMCSSPDTIRAWPGGFGASKLGANYGPSLQANQDCVKKGYCQVLWLLGKEGIVTEAGASNFFTVIKDAESGKTQILTCPLSTGVILPGVTRRSVLELLRQKFADDDSVEVVEKEFTDKDLDLAAKDNRLLEAFVVGTAYFVSPVGLINTRNGGDIQVPLTAEGGQTGPIAQFCKEALSNIQWGKVPHQWSHLVCESD